MNKGRNVPNILGRGKTQGIQRTLTRSGDKRTVAMALVSGWVGPKRVAIRFTEERSTKWHIYPYQGFGAIIPGPHEHMEDPCPQSSNGSSWGSETASSPDPENSR